MVKMVAAPAWWVDNLCCNGESQVPRAVSTYTEHTQTHFNMHPVCVYILDSSLPVAFLSNAYSRPCIESFTMDKEHLLPSWVLYTLVFIALAFRTDSLFSVVSEFYSEECVANKHSDSGAKLICLFYGVGPSLGPRRF